MVKTKIFIFRYVNDSISCILDFKNSLKLPIQQLVDRMTHDAQLWLDILWFLCRSDILWFLHRWLELNKSSYYILSHVYDKKGGAKINVIPRHEPIKIIDQQTNQPILICYKTPYMPHKTLGYQKSPVRDWNPQHHKCLKKGIATMQAIATCAINREQAQQLYWSVLVPKIGYTLPQPYKTELTLCHTQQCVTKLFPLKFSQNTHKSIVYGSKNLGGLGLLDWFHLQGKS